MAQSGYTPILIYASGTAAAVPSAANLTSSANGAELALNYADGKLYYKNSSGVVTLLAQAGGNPPGGSNTYVQYNNAGAFGGSANFVWDNSNVRLGIGTSSPGYTLEVVGSAGLNTSGTSVLATFGANNTTDKYLRIRNSSGHFQIGTASSSHYLYGAGAIPLYFYTNGTERFRITDAGAWGLSGANYGSAGQALVSQGSSSPPVWGSAGVSTAKAVALALVFG